MSIEPVINGDNVLLIAPTGIGKTEACFLPLLHKLIQEEHKPISTLYITPLRSLNRDLLSRLYWWGDKLGIDISVRHGDTTQTERAEQRENPSHVFIVTPETLQAILPGKKMREHLRNVKHVVIDEIHELVESKRGVQLSVVLERLREIAGDFQRIGLSATVGSPEIVAEFLGKNVKIVRAEATKEYKIRVESPQPTAKDIEISDDLLIGVNTTARLRHLYELIKGSSSVLVFTNTRETAEVISSRLHRLDRELKQTVHHGSLSREKRIHSEQKFKAQELKSLIATSSLELGIDIGSIDLVVQYLSPRQVSRLIQRIGRAGHGVGRVSRGTIISGDEDVFESTVIANMAVHRRLEPVKVHELAYDVLANQIIGMNMDEYATDSDKIYSVIKKAYPYRNLRKKEFNDVIKLIESINMLFVNTKKEGFELKRRKKTFTYYFDNLSTIPDTRQYKVISVIENEPIGSLDEAFIAEHGQAGNRFVVAGRAWKIIQVYENKIIVEPVDDIESAIPAWEGELIPVPFEVAQKVGELRRLVDKDSAKLDEYDVDSSTMKEMRSIVEKHKEKHALPDDKNILVENYKDFVIIHSCAGSLANNTLGKYIASILTAETGVAVNIKTDPYRIMLQTVATPDSIVKILKEAKNLDEVLRASLERSTTFKWRFLQVARRFGIVSRNAQFDKLNINKIVSVYAGTPVYEETMRELFHEKMDVECAKEMLRRIGDSEIKIHVQGGLSFLGEAGLVQQFSEVMKPRMPEKEILQAFKRRLLSTRVRLLCTNCAEYTLVTKVRNMPDHPECPKCSSRLIAVIRRGQINAQEIVRKKLKKKAMTKEEMEEFQTIRRSSDLVIVYGRKAAEVLAGHGVGPQTASRILAMLHTNKEQFYKDILAAEKQFARTKIYWK